MNVEETENKNNLISLFIDRYLPRNEIIHRLPLSMPIDAFWTELMAARRSHAATLPLNGQNGEPFWFVVNKTIEEQCDAVAEFARKDYLFDGIIFDVMADDALLDEAVFSSMIEGAFTSKKEASAFIHGSKAPKNKSEQMVLNNYDALTFVLEHLDEPITEKTLIQIAEILTRSDAEVQVHGYRSERVYVNGPNGPVYTPPDASNVPVLMHQLIAFLHSSELHPVLKACIAHFYLVYIHPFSDGNGRTARALSLMILLQSGYDFFRYFSISDIVAKERGRYYRAMKNVEESNGDMTYFIDCYSGMLSRTVKRMEDHFRKNVFADRKIKQLQMENSLNDRQIKGASWLLKSGLTQITVEEWKKKFKVVTETARRDLLLLSDIGVVVRKQDRRKAVFLVTNDFDK